MKTLSKSLLALSLSFAALASTQALASDGKCGTDFGRISVVGEGEVKVMPDLATLEYRVSAIKDNAKTARDEVEKTVNSFSKAVGELKLDKDAFIADNITVMPRYKWNEKAKKQDLIGYEASRNVSIKLKDFALIGKASDLALKAGINQISGFSYSVSEPKKYETQAAEMAVADAKEKAALLAKGFDAEIGAPCSLSFEEHNYPGPYRAVRAMAYSASAESDSVEQATYSAEKVTITSKVNASFSIK